MEINKDMSVIEVCNLLHVTPPTVYKLLRTGELKGYKIGSRTRRITYESVKQLRNGWKAG